LRQILLNLVANAVKFTSEGSIAVDVAAEDLDHQTVLLRISVTDTGIGIPADQQSKLFTKFTQVDGSSRRRYGGTGLGLAISKSLALLMEGNISVVSEPGRGSTFCLQIPVGKVPGVRQAPAWTSPDVEPLAAGNARVLLADDNSVNQLVISRMLRRLGFAVDVAENGAAALERWQSAAYDLILMDCQMPVMDGYEAAAAIRRAKHPGRSVPIIAITANVMERDAQRCSAAGMDGYLTKPVTLADLRSALQPFAPVPPAHQTNSEPVIN
jgi:CheY-like chemotaxis protein